MSHHTDESDTDENDAKENDYDDDAVKEDDDEDSSLLLSTTTNNVGVSVVAITTEMGQTLNRLEVTNYPSLFLSHE